MWQYGLLAVRRLREVLTLVPDLVKIDTRVEAQFLEADRRLYLKDAQIEFLRPQNPTGFQTTETRTRKWFISYGDESGEDVTIIFKVPDFDDTLEAKLEGVTHVRMLGENYKVQRIDRPKPGQARIYFIHTTIKKFVKRNFRIP